GRKIESGRRRRGRVPARSNNKAISARSVTPQKSQRIRFCIGGASWARATWRAPETKREVVEFRFNVSTPPYDSGRIGNRYLHGLRSRRNPWEMATVRQ